MIEYNPIKKIAKDQSIASKLTNESSRKSMDLIDQIISESDEKSGGIFTDFNYLKNAKAEAERFLNNGYNIGKYSLLVPVGAWGLSHGFAFPDSDISIMGIGNHRFFLFHSAIGLVVLRYFYKQWAVKHDSGVFSNRVYKKVSGAVLGTYAMGVGLHLAVDVFQPKSIVFPFFGSPVNGTLVDDNIWLLGNSLWAFKIGRDIFALTMADEISTAKNYVKEKFGTRFNFNDLKETK